MSSLPGRGEPPNGNQGRPHVAGGQQHAKTLGFVSVSVNTFSLILIAAHTPPPPAFQNVLLEQTGRQALGLLQKSHSSFLYILTRKAANSLIASSYVLCVIVVVKGMERSCHVSTQLLFFLFLLHQTNGISLS